MATWWAPRVRTLVGVLLLFVLALPFGLLRIERIFENALVLETEHALIVEGVVIGEAYRALVRPEAARRPLEPAADDKHRYAPIVPRLDLAGATLLPPATRRGAASSSTTAAGALTPLLERALVRNLSGMRVLDANGAVVASPLRVTGYHLDHLPEVAAALRGEYQPVLRRRFSDEPDPPLSSLSRAAELRVSLAIPVFADPRSAVGQGAEVIGVVYGSRTPLDTTKALWAWRSKLYVPFAVSLAVTLLAVLFLTFTLSRPLSRLRRHAERVAAGDSAVGYRVGRIAPQEVYVLSEALERMSVELSRRADYIREFAANAAHELKTPLTSLRGAAELLIETDADMPVEQRRRFMENIQNDAVRMDQLVQRILELARIEASRPERADVALAEFLPGLAERYRRRAHAVRYEGPTEGGVVSVVVDQLESALVNLLDNAVRHGEGEDVQLGLRIEEGWVEVEVRDHGPALEAGALDRVFERFYSTTRAQGGTGLGLAIVQAVVLAHGGAVVSEVLPRGARFVVRLPLRP